MDMRYAAFRAPPGTRPEHPARAEPWRQGSPEPIPNSAVKPAIAESTAVQSVGG